jgi:hypothetical protein
MNIESDLLVEYKDRYSVVTEQIEVKEKMTANGRASAQ